MSKCGYDEDKKENLVNVESALDILYDDILKHFTQKVQETHETSNNNIDNWRTKTFGCIHYLKKDLKQKRDEEKSRTDELSQRVFILENKFTQLRNRHSPPSVNSKTRNWPHNSSCDKENFKAIIEDWNCYVKRSNRCNRIMRWPDKCVLSRLKGVPHSLAMNDVLDLPSRCFTDETDGSKDGYLRDLQDWSKRMKKAASHIEDFVRERKINRKAWNKSRKAKVVRRSYCLSLTSTTLCTELYSHYAHYAQRNEEKKGKAINYIQDVPSGCSSDDTKDFRCKVDGYLRDLHKGTKRTRRATSHIKDFVPERKLNGAGQTRSRRAEVDDPVINKSYRWSLILKKPLKHLIKFTGPVVYTGQPGYRLQLKARLDSQKGVISIAVRLIKGIYDNKLTWPFQKNVLCGVFMGKLLKKAWIIKPKWSYPNFVFASTYTNDTSFGLTFQNYWSTWCGPFDVQDVLCANELLIGISLI